MTGPFPCSKRLSDLIATPRSQVDTVPADSTTNNAFRDSALHAVNAHFDRITAAVGTERAANQDCLRSLGAVATTRDVGWVQRVRELGLIDAALDQELVGRRAESRSTREHRTAAA